jgi:hypothetical protein
VYNTPEGMLASDVVPAGVYVPEVVMSKNVRKARGRMRVRRSLARQPCWGRCWGSSAACVMLTAVRHQDGKVPACA